MSMNKTTIDFSARDTMLGGNTMGTQPAKPNPNHELTKQIEALIRFKGGGHNEKEVADIIENALKLLTDVQDTGDIRVIQTAVRELRYAFRLFAPYAGKRKVTIFGSARTQSDALE